MFLGTVITTGGRKGLFFLGHNRGYKTNNRVTGVIKVRNATSPTEGAEAANRAPATGSKGAREFYDSLPSLMVSLEAEVSRFEAVKG